MSNFSTAQPVASLTADPGVVRVEFPAQSQTFVDVDHEINIAAHSRRAFVYYWQKYVHKVLASL